MYDLLDKFDDNLLLIRELYDPADMDQITITKFESVSLKQIRKYSPEQLNQIFNNIHPDNAVYKFMETEEFLEVVQKFSNEKAETQLQPFESLSIFTKIHLEDIEEAFAHIMGRNKMATVNTIKKAYQKCGMHLSEHKIIWALKHASTEDANYIRDFRKEGAYENMIDYYDFLNAIKSYVKSTPEVYFLDRIRQKLDPDYE